MLLGELHVLLQLRAVSASCSDCVGHCMVDVVGWGCVGRALSTGCGAAGGFFGEARSGLPARQGLPLCRLASSTHQQGWCWVQSSISKRIRIHLVLLVLPHARQLLAHQHSVI